MGKLYIKISWIFIFFGLGLMFLLMIAFILYFQDLHPKEHIEFTCNGQPKITNSNHSFVETMVCSKVN